MNREQARAYLAARAPGVSRFTFQTFDDNEDRKSRDLARIMHGTLDECWDTLVALNERGAGIFVMVQEGDGKGRTNANVTGIRAVFLDLDGTPMPRRSTLPLRPHVGVASSPGRFHLYWRVRNVPIAAYRPIQKWLAQRYRGDNVIDPARVMRVPGFYHRKREPYLVRMLGVRKGDPYTLKELTTAWPALREALAPPAPKDGPSTSPVVTTSSSYAEAALTGEWQAVKNARPPAHDRPGERNNILNRAAFNLGTLVGAGIIAEDEARNTLLDAVSRQAVPLPDQEAKTTIARGLADGKRNPRSIE